MMITLDNDSLIFRFPQVGPLAGCSIDFQRTLRVPDGEESYPLPPGLDEFPLEHVDDYPNLPLTYQKRGGVFLPMYQSEAMWISFNGQYPCAIKVAAGKINAVSGETWEEGLSSKKQDYIVSDDQPWLDGFNVSDGLVRQFVATPLGQGFTTEEQITGKAEHGGLQIAVYPMKAAFYEKLDKSYFQHAVICCDMTNDLGMGLAPGGLIDQEISDDIHGLDAWDVENGTRCFVHIINSEQYSNITGASPPHSPLSADDYEEAELPWFDYYSDRQSVEGSEMLNSLKSVKTKMIESSGIAVDDESFQPENIKTLRKRKNVRDYPLW